MSEAFSGKFLNGGEKGIHRREGYDKKGGRRSDRHLIELENLGLNQSTGSEFSVLP
jgi:hypothetical protein